MLMEVRELLPRYNLSNDSGTFQLKLPRMGQIKGLDVLLEWTNGASGNQTESVYDAIDRIEVVANGHTRLFSLTGQQARVWSHAALGRRPLFTRNQTASAVQNAWIHIPFGLGMYNMNHYLNCAAYQDLELRIEYSPTIAATQFVTSTGYLTEFAHMFARGNPPPPNGLLKITEQVFFTSAASGDESVDLPIGNPILAMGLYVYESGVSPAANIDEFKVDVDNGFWVPVEGRFEDLQRIYAQMLGFDLADYGIVSMSNTDAINTYAGDLTSLMLQKLQSLTIGTTDEVHQVLSAVAGGNGTLQSLSRDAAASAADAANTTDVPTMFNAQGEHGIGNFLFVPFGWPTYPDLALMSGDFGRVRVTMTQGNAGAACRLAIAEIVQQ